MSETIVFFGSGPVAASSISQLAKRFDFEYIVTKPQPPALQVAQQHCTKVFSVSSKQQVSKVIAENKPKSLLGVVVDFGFIIDKSVIDAFEFGIVNSHFSLLPQWRGADPISFSILSGQQTTGVSLMLINGNLDEGELLDQQVLSDSPRDLTGPELTDRLVGLSGEMLSKTIPLYLDESILPHPQKTDGVSYSRKLAKRDGRIDWHKPADVLEREIRAFADWPKSQTELGGIEIIITKAHVGPSTSQPPATIQVIGKQLIVSTPKGSVIIDSLKPAGKKEMTTEAFLAGYRDRLVDGK